MSAETFAMWQADAARWVALQGERDELLAMLHRFVDPDRDLRRFPDAYSEGRALVARLDPGP